MAKGKETDIELNYSKVQMPCNLWVLRMFKSYILWEDRSPSTNEFLYFDNWINFPPNTSLILEALQLVPDCYSERLGDLYRRKNVVWDINNNLYLILLYFVDLEMWMHSSLQMVYNMCSLTSVNWRGCTDTNTNWWDRSECVKTSNI